MRSVKLKLSDTQRFALYAEQFSEHADYCYDILHDSRMDVGSAYSGFDLGLDIHYIQYVDEYIQN